ncbi:ABC transporter permease [Geobacillus icigianus]|uniref:ABC3 transporter permease C-terminal domain-containing protein n=3 Tax=Geobacillus TaxID=129337 RepID=A0A679FUX1_9BACL|nr:ABC transporter permease [Geobacillus subterraneus]KYD28238.1 hypothetical protein B4113_3821 [Geobacillus sp. B4113_201601]BBW95521.1 hypothetical protein GsuE55_03540 [Geobacillus subterraneus]
MRYATITFSSIRKRKRSMLLMALQLVVSFWMINHALITLDTLHYQEKQLFSVSNMDEYKTVKLTMPDGDDSQWFAERFQQLETYIKRLPEVEGYGSFNTTSIAPEDFARKQAYEQRNRQLYAGTRREEETESSSIIYFDYDIYRLFTKFRVSKGRTLEKADFQKENNDVIPVLVGYDYRDVFRIGDRFKAEAGAGESTMKVTYEVVGILEKGSRWLSGNDYLINRADNLDHFFVAPFFPEQREGRPISVAVRLHNTFLQLRSEKQLQAVSAALRKKGNELGISPVLRTVRQDVDAYQANTGKSYDYALAIGVFFLVVTLIGVISVTISAIRARKYELGVMMVTGASKRDISVMVIVELFFLVGISAVIGVIVNYWTEVNHDFFGDNIRLEAFTWSLYGKVAIIAIAIILLSALIPLWNIKNLELRELVEGRE